MPLKGAVYRVAAQRAIWWQDKPLRNLPLSRNLPKRG